MRAHKMALLHGIVSVMLLSFCPNLLMAQTAEPLVAQTGEIQLRSGFSDILWLGDVPDTIVVGNPDVLEATVGPAGRTIVLTAKKSGETNLIALDKNGGEIVRVSVEVVEVDGALPRKKEPIVRSRITIRYPSPRDSAGTVQVFSCSPNCDLAPLASKGTPTNAREVPASAVEGGQCNHPDDIAADGTRCGDRAASERPGGR